jgi:hypothetical protein
MAALTAAAAPSIRQQHFRSTKLGFVTNVWCIFKDTFLLPVVVDGGGGRDIMSWHSLVMRALSQCMYCLTYSKSVLQVINTLETMLWNPTKPVICGKSDADKVQVWAATEYSQQMWQEKYTDTYKGYKLISRISRTYAALNIPRTTINERFTIEKYENM